MDLNFKIFESNEEPDKKPIQTKKPICSCCDCHIANKTISVMVLNDVNLFIVNILCFKASLLVAARVLLEYFLTELAFSGWKVPTEVQEMQAHKKISQLNGIFQQSKGSPHKNVEASIWALPVWGGGLDPCQDGLGHLFREELSKFKWAFA